MPNPSMIVLARSEANRITSNFEFRSPAATSVLVMTVYLKH